MTRTFVSQLDDRQLVQRHLNGDPTAFGNLVDRYQARLLAFVNRMVRDPERAEDLVQQVFIRAFRHLQGFDRARTFSSWMYTIAANLTKAEIIRVNAPQGVSHAEAPYYTSQ